MVFGKNREKMAFKVNFSNRKDGGFGVLLCEKDF